MRIGLIDVDNFNKKAKFPNLALMKLSAYHKSIGDYVEWYDSFVWQNPYDIVYQAKVFDFSPEPDLVIYANKIIKGGVAYSLENKLPKNIEHIYPDYELYEIKDKAYGFMTRGCPRNCSFCNVTEHQGNISRKVANLSEFWNGQKEIVLLDPNLTACKDHEELFNQLINSKATIDYTQGIDIRTMTKERAELLKKTKFKVLHFAWDNYELKTYEKLKQAREWLDIDKRKLVVYVLVNFNTTIEQDLERIYKLKELEYSPYIMIYDKFNATKTHRNMARWVNNRFIWHSCNTFDEYLKGE